VSPPTSTISVPVTLGSTTTVAVTPSTLKTGP
jgi:hypothetical protein